MHQRHAHAAFHITFGLAKQAQRAVGHGQRVGHAVKHDAHRIDPAVNHGAGTRALERGVHRQAQDGAGMQLKLVLPLGDHGHHAGVVRARADLTEPDLLTFDKQLYPKQALAAQVVGHGTRDTLRPLLRRRGHGAGLPALHIVTTDLQMADGRAKLCGHLAVGTQRAHGEQRDLVVEVDEAFHDHPARAHAATGHRVVPGGLHVRRAVDLALAFAAAAHHRFDDAGVADAGLASNAINRRLQVDQ